MSERDNIDRASQFDELRFAKGQQWYIATAAVTLLSAIFWIERSIKLKYPEKVIATVFIGLIAGFGICFLVKLQKHLKAVRLELNPNDPNPWWRGFRCFVRTYKRRLACRVSGALFFVVAPSKLSSPASLATINDLGGRREGIADSDGACVGRLHRRRLFCLLVNDAGGIVITKDIHLFAGLLTNAT